MIKRVVIIGAGRIGRTIANLLAMAHPDTHLLLSDINPQLVPHQVPLASSVPTSGAVFICTPSWSVRQILTDLRGELPSGTPVIILAKGIEAASGKTMVEVADEVLGLSHPHGVLGGPMLAEALEHGHRGIGVIGSISATCRQVVAELFAGTPLEVRGSAAAGDIALAGCLKNVYAFIVGIMSGLAWSPVERQRGFRHITTEFLRVGEALGIAPDIIHGPAGLGDFEETATSPSSHNHYCGFDSVAHNAIVCTCEGTVSAGALAQRLEQVERFPWFHLLLTTIAGKKPVADFNFLRSENTRS